MHHDLADEHLTVSLAFVLSTSAQLDIRQAPDNVLPAHVRVDSFNGVLLAEQRVAAVGVDQLVARARRLGHRHGAQDCGNVSRYAVSSYLVMTVRIWLRCSAGSSGGSVSAYRRVYFTEGSPIALAAS